MQTAEQNRRIILSGSSGLIGTALRQEFAANGRPVLRLVRGLAKHDDELEWNSDALPAAEEAAELDDCEAAIHLSGASVAGEHWTPAWLAELTRSRVNSTVALARLLASLRHPPRTLLVASAVGFYGDRGNEILDETSAPGTGFLANLCREWEAAAQPARGVGIRVVHLRFGVVLSPASGALAKMLPLFRMGLGGPLGSGRQWMSWIGLQDAVAAIRFALKTPAVEGALNLTAPNPVTNAEFTRLLAHQLHRPAILPAPAFALRLAFGKMADETLLASTRAMPSRLLTHGFQFKHGTLHEALCAALS
jgi:uncharacterized protein